MRGWGAALVLLAGCDGVFGLVPVQAGPDGATDAPLLTCAAQPDTPFLCADFDETAPVVFENGVATMLVPAPAGATYQRRMPALSPPNALWIDSSLAAYRIDDTQAAGVVHALHAKFGLQIDRAPPNYAFEVVQIGITGTGPNDCSANLQIVAQEPSVKLMASCGGVRVTQVAQTGIPAGWVHYTLDLDVDAAAAWLTIDAQDPVGVDLQGFAPVAGPAQVRAGTLYVQGTTGPALALDDLVVRVAP